MSEQNDHDQSFGDRQTPNLLCPLRVDRRLLEILVCPVTRGPLEYVERGSVLVSRQAGLAYPIRDGIPIMLAEEASRIDSSGG